MSQSVIDSIDRFLFFFKYIWWQDEILQEGWHRLHGWNGLEGVHGWYGCWHGVHGWHGGVHDWLLVVNWADVVKHI